MDLLTIGDFYRKRYGRAMELGTSVVIAISYLGWTAAQLTALGLVFSTLTGGAISLQTGIIISGVIVLAYTIWGGMWSVAMTDLFQSVMIILGLRDHRLVRRRHGGRARQGHRARPPRRESSSSGPRAAPRNGSPSSPRS